MRDQRVYGSIQENTEIFYAPKIFRWKITIQANGVILPIDLFCYSSRRGKLRLHLKQPDPVPQTTAINRIGNAGITQRGPLVESRKFNLI